MGESSSGGAPLFQEIRTLAPEAVAAPYRRLRLSTNAVYVLGGLYAAALVVRIPLLMQRWSLLGQVVPGAVSTGLYNAVRQNDFAIQLLSLVTVALVVFAYIAGGVWIYHAAKNVRGLGARGLETSPSWAVGWYFIPFMSLFRPYQAMREIYQASVSPGTWRSAPVSPVLSLWWAAWLIAGLAGNALFIGARGVTSPSGIQVVTLATIGDSVLSVVALVLFIFVVNAVSTAQQRSEGRGVAHIFA
jgi:hypothetical protein